FGLEDGVVYYVNPAAFKIFPDIKEQGTKHPILADLNDSVAPLLQKVDATSRREVSIGEICYFQTINYVPETRRVRVYNSDISDRKRIQADLDQQNTDLQLI